MYTKKSRHRRDFLSHENNVLPDGAILYKIILIRRVVVLGCRNPFLGRLRRR